MKDSDMIIAEITDSNLVTINDYYSDSYNAPATDIERKGTNDISLLGYSDYSTNKERIVKFRRKQNTGDRYDKSLAPNDHLDVIVARTGSKKMQDHEDDFWIYKVNFVQGFKGDAIEEDKSIRTIIRAHALINIIGWGFLADIGIFSARNLKHKSFYITIHVICFLLNDFGSIIIGIVILAKRTLELIFISITTKFYSNNQNQRYRNRGEHIQSPCRFWNHKLNPNLLPTCRRSGFG
jgi:hypothetical protein